MEDPILKSALAPGAECLPLEQLGRYGDGALRGDEQTAAAAHIGRCLSCQAELALMRELTAVSLRAGEAPAVPASPARSFRFGPFPLAAVAAAAVIAIATGSFYFVTRRTPALPGSVTTGDEVARSLAIRVRGPIGDQLESPRRFEWLPVAGAVRYRVRLLEVDRREVWSTATSEPGADLPLAVRTSIAAARTFLWDVAALDAAGTAIAESGTQSFRVLPR